jgi:hypothetical protein
MTNKKCSSCNELKSTTKFSKYKLSKDGLQPHCKQCQSVRTKAVNKADKEGIIYTITNPISEVYTGITNRDSHLRFLEHRRTYKFTKSTGHSNFPKLHKSFDKWGIDAHIFKVISNHGNISKKQLRQIESNMIIALKQNGKSLNVND